MRSEVVPQDEKRASIARPCSMFKTVRATIGRLSTELYIQNSKFEISLPCWVAKRPESVRKQPLVVFPRVCIPLAVYCLARR